MVLNKTNETGKSKPRLACMERGPGPVKYYLPGTCGDDPTKNIKPAYSLGNKHKQHSVYKSPDPFISFLQI